MSTLRAMLIYYKLKKIIFHSHFLNVNISVTVNVRHLIFSTMTFDISKEGTVSQIFDL